MISHPSHPYGMYGMGLFNETPTSLFHRKVVEEGGVGPRHLYLFLIPSSMGHVKPRVNQRGPPRKAKYSWVTDSEEVP